MRFDGVRENDDSVRLTLAATGDLHIANTMRAHQRQHVFLYVSPRVGVLISCLRRNYEQLIEFARPRLRLKNPAQQDSGRFDAHAIGQDCDSHGEDPRAGSRARYESRPGEEHISTGSSAATLGTRTEQFLVPGHDGLGLGEADVNGGGGGYLQPDFTEQPSFTPRRQTLRPPGLV